MSDKYVSLVKHFAPLKNVCYRVSYRFVTSCWLAHNKLPWNVLLFSCNLIGQLCLMAPVTVELACEKWPLPTTVQFSIVHARNSSRDWSDLQALLIVRSVVKLREFRGNKKNCDNSDLLRKTYARLTQCSKPVKKREKPVFFKFYSSRFLDGFERLSAEATFCTPAHTAKM